MEFDPFFSFLFRSQALVKILHCLVTIIKEFSAATGQIIFFIFFFTFVYTVQSHVTLAVILSSLHRPEEAKVQTFRT